MNYEYKTIKRKNYGDTPWGSPCLYSIKDRQAPGVPFKGFHWMRFAEDLTSRFQACARWLPTKVKVEHWGKYGGGSGEIQAPLAQRVTSALQAALTGAWRSVVTPH